MAIIYRGVCHARSSVHGAVTSEIAETAKSGAVRSNVQICFEPSTNRRTGDVMQTVAFNQPSVSVRAADATADSTTFSDKSLICCRRLACNTSQIFCTYSF